MNPWLETFGVCLLGVAGVGLGLWFSRLPKPWWTLGYFLPFTLIVLIALARRHSAFQFVPPLSWLMAGRTPLAMTALIVTMVLTTPLSRLSSRRDKGFVVLFMVVLVSVASIWPFAAPAFNRKYLASLKTRIDVDGICLQSSSYNCGPAAAVTALRQLGFAAEEGQVAILAHTSQAMGTPPDLLARALQKQYARDGLQCEFKHFKSVSELKQAGLTLAVIKFGLLLDHYVVVLEVTDENIVVGDPLLGKTTLSVEEFAKKWRFCGVVLKRKT